LAHDRWALDRRIEIAGKLMLADVTHLVSRAVRPVDTARLELTRGVVSGCTLHEPST
jgi:hypothetical protein